MAEDIINIPLYYNFKFYRLEFDAEVFHNRRYLWYSASMTNFWEKIYRTFFNTEAEECLRHLVDYTINYRHCGLRSFGITFLNEETNQFRNTNLEYNKADILTNRTTVGGKGEYIYKEYDFEHTVGRLVSNGVNEEWAGDLVRRVNSDEREIIKFIAEKSKGKEWNFLKSYFLTDGYIKQRLYNQGIKNHQLNYDLIEAEKLIIETNRKLKNAKI